MKNFSKIVDNFDVTTKKYVDDGLAEKANSADLATVATSGSYNDLSNKPTIPDVSGLMPKSGGAFTGNISVPSTITFTDTTNPYIKMTTGGTAFYFQSTSGQFGLGPTWDKATHWNSNGNVTFPTTPKVGDISLALVSDIPSVPANYVTTDTAQTISGSKTFTAQPIINTPNGLKFTSGNCALRIYNTSASPTDYSAIEVRSNSSSTNRNLFIDLDNNSLVVGQASGTADTTYKVNVKDSFNATTIYENGTSLANKYLGKTAKAADADKLDGNDSAYYLNYNNLSNKPTIPTVNNGTLTIQKNGTDVATFGANQSTNTTANITVPTKVGQLENDSGYTTNKGTVTQVKINGTTNSPDSAGLVDLGTVGGSSDNSKNGYTELTNENLNTITEAGWYRAASNSTCANKPSAFTSIPFILEVEKSADVYIKQTTYTTKNSSDAFSTTYVRFSIDSGNTWTSWGKTQTMSDNKIQTFSGLKTFSGGIDVFYSPLRFNSDAGSGGKFAMSQGATTSPKWVNLQVRVNGTTYTADSDGLIDLGEISGGGSGASTSQYNDIY